MVESLSTMVDKHIKEQVEKQVPEQERGRLQDEISSQIQQAIDNNIPFLVDASMKFETLQVPQTTCRTSAIRPRDQDDPHDDAPPEGENSAKWQKTSDRGHNGLDSCLNRFTETEEQCSISLGNQKQVDNYDFWTESYASDDDEIPTKQVSQDIMEEVSLTINEAELRKILSKTYWQLGHEHKFITEIVARRANECIVSITESDYKNLNKNDIEDIYLLIMNGKVPDYAETCLLWSLSVFIRSLVIWERVHDFQLGIESYQQKIHKFCDATLNRVLEGLKSYNNDVKYDYKQRDLTEDEVEYLKLFEEEIE
ncbi:hypothetical protein Tco_1442204, partial [Tanacetum coccineum]